MKLEQDVSNGSKRKQIYKCDWLWQTGYYAKTKQKGGRGMREGWEYKKLGDSCVIEYGTRVVQKKDGGTIYPVYGGGGETFRMDKYNRENCLVVARFAMSRTCVRYVTGKFFLNDSGLSINAGKELLQSYLNHHILHLNDDIYNLGKGAAQRNLDVNSFRNLIIAIPPLSTQLSIVSELDKINELIRLKNEQLNDYDKLSQSIFYEMFGDPVENEKGWDNSTIESVCSSIVRGPFGSALKKEFFVEPTNDTYKVYEQKHAIQKNHIIGSYYITKEKFQELRRFEVFPGDIIMSCSGTIGEFYQIPKEAEKGVMNQALLKFTLNENRTTTEFFMFLMNFIKNSFETKGTGLQNIGSVKVIKSTILGLPPLPLQQTFAQRIELIEKQKAEVQRTIADLETLLASRMQYWFG